MPVNKKASVSIVIPAYNEGKGIKKAMKDLHSFMKTCDFEYEIIVVNDGSSDNTGEIIKKMTFVRLIEHPYNKGYGGALKTGIRAAQYEWITIFDSDGQHDPKDIIRLRDNIENFDMVVGARKGYKGPLVRQPGKLILLKTAEFLVSKKIPDLNSGLRTFKRDLALKFIHLFPNTFSLTTTITLTFFKEGLNVKYIPITIKKRTGTSTVKVRDLLVTIMLILRIITLFSPLRIFLPLSAFIFLLGLISVIFGIISRNITDTTILLFISSIIIFFFGLLTDQVAALRRESRPND